MEDVARQAGHENLERHDGARALDRVLDSELPRYADAWERLGR